MFFFTLFLPLKKVGEEEEKEKLLLLLRDNSLPLFLSQHTPGLKPAKHLLFAPFTTLTFSIAPCELYYICCTVALQKLFTRDFFPEYSQLLRLFLAPSLQGLKIARFILLILAPLIIYTALTSWAYK